MTTLEGSLSQIPPTGVSSNARARQIITAKQRMDQIDPDRKAAKAGFVTPTEQLPIPAPLKTKSVIPGKDATLKTFSISVATLSSSGVWMKDTRYTPARIELAPARASFADRQGQRVPGADGGMVHSIHANLVKLNVPASRPIYQQLGIRDELLEWVGAFVGYDNDVKTEQGANRTFNAWAEYMDIKSMLTVGREVLIDLVWAYGYSSENTKGTYRGVIKELDVAYATEQRIYYKICVELTNREDLALSLGAGVSLSSYPILPASIAGSDTIKNSFLKAQEQHEQLQKAESLERANELTRKAKILKEATRDNSTPIAPVVPRIRPPSAGLGREPILIDGRGGYAY